MKVSDAISGAVVAATGAVIFSIAVTFPSMPGQNVGPGLFPSLIGGVMMACGALLMLKGWREWGQADWVDRSDWAAGPLANVGILIGALVFYILAAPRIGFFPAAFTILAVMMLWLRGVARWMSSLVIAAGATIVIYIFFARMLRVPLPRDFISNFF